jgi:hypothetical protein
LESGFGDQSVCNAADTLITPAARPEFSVQ